MNCLLDNYPERREDEDDDDGSAVIIIFIPPGGALLALIRPFQGPSLAISVRRYWERVAWC